jgi:hypothetical protein
MTGLLLLALPLLPVAATAAAAGAAEAPVGFKITTKRQDDAVEVRAGKRRTVIDVKSPFGISQAVIELTRGRWPGMVVVRLRLKGLSSFRVSDGKTAVDAAVSIDDGKPRVRVWKDGREDAPLDAKSPLWLDVRALGGDGKPARELPLQDGYFDVRLPRALFKGSPKSITVSWIDFYRS